MTHMRVLALTLVAAGCATPPAPRAAPTALPDYRHGHRIEPVAGGYLCFGGFAATGENRGQTGCSILACDEPQPSWQPSQPLNHAHSFFASTIIDGAVFAIGEAVERHDSATDTWHAVVGPGKLPRSHFGATAVGDQIFVLGGFPKLGTGFHIVDSVSGEVTGAPPPPDFEHGDHFHYVCALAGQLHVFGGIAGKEFELRKSHWVRSGDGWIARAACPVGLWTKFAAHIVLDDRVYLFSDAGSYRYDPADDSWRELAKPPAMVAMPVAVSDGRDIWIIGGMQVDGRTRVFWHYDVATDRMTDLTR